MQFTNKAIASVAENKIREAMEQGAFDQLPRHGEPITGLNEPFDENWWVRKWIRRERLNEVEQPGVKEKAQQHYREKRGQ